MQRYCLIHAQGEPFETFWQTNNNSEKFENVEDLDGVIITCLSLSDEMLGGICSYLEIFDIEGDFMAIKTINDERVDPEQVSKLYEQKKEHKCTLLNLDAEFEQNFYFNSSEFLQGIDICRQLLQLKLKSPSEIPKWSKELGKYEIHHWDNYDQMGVIF